MKLFGREVVFFEGKYLYMLESSRFFHLLMFISFL